VGKGRFGRLALTGRGFIDRCIRRFGSLVWRKELRLADFAAGPAVIVQAAGSPVKRAASGRLDLSRKESRGPVGGDHSDTGWFLAKVSARMIVCAVAGIAFNLRAS